MDKLWIDSFIAALNDSVSLIAMYTEHEHPALEQEMLSSTRQALAKRDFNEWRSLIQALSPELLLRILPAVPEKVLVHELFRHPGISAAAVDEFNSRSLGPQSSDREAIEAYRVARDVGLASRRTLRHYLVTKRNGFWNQYDSRPQVQMLIRQFETADHLIACLKDEEPGVVLGALVCLKACLENLLKGRLAKTGGGYRFLPHATKQEQLFEFWTARWLYWPCYVESLGHVWHRDSPYFEDFYACQFSGSYYQALRAKEAGTVVEPVDAEAAYNHWRDLTLANMDLILSLADKQADAHSLNALVFIIFEQLACDADRTVAEAFMVRRENFFSFERSAQTADAYNRGLGLLKLWFDLFEQQIG